MPKTGYRTITVKEAVYRRLKKRAKKENRNVSNMAETIILEATED